MRVQGLIDGGVTLVHDAPPFVERNAPISAVVTMDELVPLVLEDGVGLQIAQQIHLLVQPHRQKSSCDLQ